MTRPKKSRTTVVKLLLGAAFIALLVGGVATSVGVVGWVSDPDAVPTCGAKTMSADDKCDVSRGGSVVDTYTYDEKIARQHRAKDHAGETITIGLTVITVSLLAGLIVEVASRWSGLGARSTAATSGSARPPESVTGVQGPPGSETTSRRGPSRAVLAGTAGAICAVSAVLVTLVVTHRGDSSGTASPVGASSPSATTWTTNSPAAEQLRRAMPAALRAETVCRSPGFLDRDSSVIASGTCNVEKSSPLLSGLVIDPAVAAYFDAAIVYKAAAYRDNLRESPKGHVFRDDGSVFAVFSKDNGNSDPPGLGNTLRFLDLNTGLYIEMNAVDNEQDAATYLQRIGL